MNAVNDLEVVYKTSLVPGPRPRAQWLTRTRESVCRGPGYEASTILVLGHCVI